MAIDNDMLQDFAEKVRDRFGLERFMLIARGEDTVDASLDKAAARARLDDYTSLRAGLVHPLQPSHIRNADPETLGMVHLSITLPPY